MEVSSVSLFSTKSPIDSIYSILSISALTEGCSPNKSCSNEGVTIPGKIVSLSAVSNSS